METSNNTILITGGGSGIGRALAETFHALGNQVVIAGRSLAKLEDVCDANPGMEPLELDVTNPADIRRAGEELGQRFPMLNVLVNNAGIMQLEDVTTGETDVAEATVATNLLGPIRLTTTLLPILQMQPQSTIVNVSSGLAFVPLAATPTYCATKAAIHSYSVSLRRQLRDTNIQVVELVPPYVQTHLMGDQQAQDERAMPLADFIAEVMEIVTTQGSVEEIVVKQCEPLRYASERGNFSETFQRLNDSMSH
ncbi:MAG: SDR family oxidoreductase [Planctomycetales bacterium]|nr:SDR family oxidoreductase [Planctomycetales bacterium]